ncbi:MAG TPA: hypothetical protein DG048_09740 [Pseudoalteromonas sp.]|nr:hypothetical protein [Pseudoalteromonas sp.]|tara:strand:- start:174 stop:611 length:438 start_codon:yes stop_codon:yes gene_type:complete
MSFKDKPFETRFKAMGDIAETAFEERYGANFVRFGLNRPPLKMSALPPVIRYTPDYLTSNAFVEVQGLGGDQMFKLKLDKLEALSFWNNIHPVLLYVYDSHKDRDNTLDWKRLTSLCQEAKIDTFPEGKKYYAVPATLIWVNGET